MSSFTNNSVNLNISSTLSPSARDAAYSSQRLRSEEHTSELQSRLHLVCRLLLEKKKNIRRSLSTPRWRSAQSTPSTRPVGRLSSSSTAFCSAHLCQLICSSSVSATHI